MQESNEFSKFFNLTPDLACIATTAGLFLKINARWQEKLGYTEHEILSTPFWDFVHPEDIEATINEIEHLKQGKETVQFVNRYRSKDGRYIWLEWSATPDIDGNLYSIARDITQRKLEEEAIRQTEEKYRSLFENMLEGVAHIRMIFADGKPIDYEYIAVNPAFETVTGLKNLVGRRINSVIPGYSQNNPESIEMFASVANGGSPRQWEHYLAALNRWFQFCIYSPTAGEVMIVTSNITDQKNMDVALRRSESQLRQFVDQAPAALAMFDREMNYIAVSKRWIEDFALGDVDIIGHCHYKVFPVGRDDREEVHRRGLAGEVIRAEEDRFIKNDGTEQWMRWEVQPWPTVNGEIGGIIVYTENITEFKRIELELHELAAHLQNIRDEEKTTIAHEIHDDLGGTLTSIRMETHSLRYAILKKKNKQQLLDSVGAILKLTDYASGVTRQIVTGLYPTMLDDLGILAALEWKAATFKKNTGISCLINNIQGNDDLSNELGKDFKMALFRITQEALTNVSRHSSASKVEIEFSCGVDEVVLSIIDNGHGILNVDANGPGRFGILGMRERARQLGGRIILETPRGGGLSVTAILPRSLNKEK